MALLFSDKDPLISELAKLNVYTKDELSFLKEQGFLDNLDQNSISGNKEEILSLIKASTLVEQNIDNKDESFEVLATKLNKDNYQMAFRLENKSNESRDFYLIPISKTNQTEFKGMNGVLNSKNLFSVNQDDIKNQPLQTLYDVEQHKQQLNPQLAQAYTDIDNNNYQPKPVKITLDANTTLLAKSQWQIDEGRGQSSTLEPIYLLVYGSAGGAKDDITEKLKIKKDTDNKYKFKTSKNNTIEIDTEATVPYMKMDKWNGEVSLKINIPQIDKNGLKEETDKKLTISGSGNNEDVVFHVKEKEERIKTNSKGEQETLIMNENGGVEFDIVLKKKPKSNVFIYTIETQGLDFFYQPPFDEEVGPEIEGLNCNALECYDENGEIVRYRAEEVLGSYAVYHNSKSGDYTAMGGKNYMAGKAFHIYRPKVYEQNNPDNWIWGELNVDEEQGILSVTVDQDWLDNADYPVVVDPTIGDTSTASNATTWSSDRIELVCRNATTDGTGGQVSSISFYTSHTSYFSFVTAIYNTSSGLLSPQSGSVYSAGAPGGGWHTANFTGPTLFASTAYWPAVLANAPATTYYDYGTTGDTHYSTSYTYPNWPNPGSFTNSNYDYGIYATYSYVNTAPTITLVNDFPDPVKQGNDVTFKVDWNDTDIEGIKMLVCKTDAITAATPACDGGEWCSDKDDWDLTDPISCNYTTTASELGSNDYYVFVCDDKPSCSSSTSGTFTVEPIINPSMRLKGPLIIE